MQFEDIMKLVLGKGKQPEGEGEEQKPDQPKASPIPKMRKGSWRQHLDSNVHSELNKLVRNTHKHRNAYKKTLKVRDAQLWVALAQMSKRLGQLEDQLGTEQPIKPKNPDELQVENNKPESAQPLQASKTEQIAQPVENPQPNTQMLISGEPSSSAQPAAPSGQPVSVLES